MNHERFPGAKYANIFSYLKSDNHEGYKEMDEETLGLVGHIQGYLGYESVTNNDGRTIFISYWNSLKAINEWRINSRHKAAKNQSKRWYSAYQSVLVKIESYSEFNSDLL